MSWEWMQGLTCWPIGQHCVVDWAAWGTWAGAIATFIAVVVPFYASRRKDALEVELAVRDFISELNGISMQLATIDLARKTPLSMSDAEFAGLMRISAVIPVLQTIPSARRILLSLRALRRSIEEWNGYSRLALPVREGVERQPDNELVEGIITNHYNKVSENLDAVISAIQMAYPDLANQIHQRPA